MMSEQEQSGVGKRKWFERPMRIVELIEDFGQLVRIGSSQEEIAQQVAMRANTKHLHTMGTRSAEFDADSLFFATSICPNKLPDHLGAHLPIAHRQGIRVIPYFNVHWGSDAYADWSQCGCDGKPLVMHYGSGTALCVNTGFRQVAVQIVADLGAYDIDGVFLDGPIFMQKGCYCKACRALFRERFGAEMPVSVDEDEKLWQQWLTFRADSLAEFLGTMRSALERAHPDAILYANANGLFPPRATGRDNRRWARELDILAAEGGFLFYTVPGSIPIWKPGAAAKLLETQAGGKPTVVFLCGDHKPWDRYALPAAEVSLMFAQTVANGASPWFALLKEDLSTEGAVAAGKMLALLERIEGDLEGTTSAAEVALLWSPGTEDYYGTGVDYSDFTAHEAAQEAHGKSQEAFNGCYEAMVRAHIPFDVIDDVALTDGTLTRYRMVILPNSACMSDASADALRQFVHNGGSLLATFAASLYDPFGHQREDFALADVLGVHYQGAVLGPFQYDYVSATEAAREILGEMQSPLPSPPYALGVAPTSATPLLMMHEKLPSRYLALPPVSAHPAMTINRFGKGRAFYLAGNVDAFFWSHRIPEHFTWLTRPIWYAAAPNVRLVGAPQTVELILRRQGPDRLLIHLVNFTGNMQRPITQTIPLHQIQIQIAGAGPKGVRALVAEEELVVRQTQEDATVVLEQLDGYEILSCAY
ncbi:MAG: alpha-amylase family protein [Candidatus Latescibacterota bacterium]